MASDLSVALRLRGTVLQVGCLEHGVFAKALASGEYRLLATALLLEVVVLCPSLALERLVVDEKVELICRAEEVGRSRQAVPWACLGTLRP